MIPRSSPSLSSGASGTAACGRGTDIIDLDHFMRASVRPSRACGERGFVCNSHKHPLPVDAGYPHAQSGSSSSCSERRHRHSLDSGVSDPSYVYRHRRSTVDSSCIATRQPRSKAIERRDSLRAFRVECKRTLQEQKEQIDRVAKLCEHLAAKSEHRTQRANRTPTEVTYTGDTSDLSSSSRTTQQPSGKHRTDGIKTYKMIMHKLDDLNKLFMARRASPRVVQRSTSDSASTSEMTADVTQRRVLVERGVGDVPCCAREQKSKISSLRTTNLHAVDIAPKNEILANVMTKSLKNHISSNSSFASNLHHPDLKLRSVPQTGKKRPRSLCAMCHGYWKWIQQLFYTDDTS